MSRRILSAILCLFAFAAVANDANRFAYLEDPDPFYPTRDFPKLITPQWIGEPGVDAAIILSIDDMRDPAKYETFLRPIIDKLKERTGRASMSIMACSVKPDDPILQTWLQEGISIECHTVAHPCPLLAQGNIDKARATYQSCIDLISSIPGNTPVAFRMPCCDSINSLSPRFFFEMFNKSEPGLGRLAIDSSVFNITTANDPALPREWGLREDGRERFRAYLPFKAFMTTIEDYPYPYIIGGTCWEFPCAVPSDWEGQNVNKPYSEQTLADMKIALDAAVLKKGVYTLVFHPHGWIRNDQVVDLIEHAVSKYGQRVRFLSFADAYRRLNSNVTENAPKIEKVYPSIVRQMDLGFVRLIDLNQDGFMDCIYEIPPDGKLYPVDVNGDGKPEMLPIYHKSDGTSTVEASYSFPVCRIWDKEVGRWRYVDGPDGSAFGVDRDRSTFAIGDVFYSAVAERFNSGKWEEAPSLEKGFGRRRVVTTEGAQRQLRTVDINNDGTSELLVWSQSRSAAYSRTAPKRKWKSLPFSLPSDALITDAQGRDNGLRFVDFDGDGDLDIIVSNQDYYALYLFENMKTGWSKTVLSGKREGADPATAIPPITINGESNGAWFKARTMWVANEHTDKQPDLVERRTYNDLLATETLGPKSPAVALASIQVHAGLKVELVAAEPLVQDPIAIAFGPDGKLWVVEMRDYPLGMDGKGKPGSRVKYLEDLDHDGVYDKASIFLDKLSFATGVIPWRDGVIVTAAPLVFFARDKNGDGKADEQQTLFEGFGQGNQQHRANGLRWGLDNWIHAANGDSGGQVKSGKTGDVIDISGRDFRFNPDSGVLDPQSGNSQFGIAIDDWGGWWGCANWLPVWHYALDDTYLRRNPHFAPVNPREYVIKPDTLYPTSRTLTRFNDFEFYNKATSTCGIEIYRDTLLGPEYYGNAFVCEPVHDLVLRTVLEPNGVTYKGHRAPGEEQQEFLSSHDNWFRPVMARTGPDGALYIVDMYRQVIEHPEYISKETQATLDLRAGDTMGRIYRVSPVHGECRQVPNLRALSAVDLVAHLESPNGTLRDMIHQELVERADVAAVAPLRVLAAKSPAPQVRVHALAALDGLSALTADDVTQALADKDAGVRKNALRLAEPRMNDWAALAEPVLALRDDADPMVHLQLIYALGSWNDARAGELLARFMERDVTDPYLSMALLSSVNARNEAALLGPLLAWSANGDAAEHGRDQVVSMAVGLAIASKSADTLQQLAALITRARPEGYTPDQYRWLAQFVDALNGRSASLDALGTGDAADAVRKSVGDMMASARAIALNESAEEEARANAVQLMGHEPSQRDADIAALGQLLDPKNPGGVVTAALGALIDTGDDRVPATVVAAWAFTPPESHQQMVAALMSRDAWTDALLTALEQGTPNLRELDAAHRQRLLNSKRDDVRMRAEKLMASIVNSNRQAVIEQYRAAATMPGQFLRGRGIFKQRCASCHQLGTVGHAVGPDLASLTDKSPEALLVSILDPNRAIETKFFNYSVATKDLSTHDGIVAEESGNSITLRSANGIETTLLRGDIESIQSTGRSPMPDGLEDGLSVEDVANLIAFVLDARPKPKEFEGNKPAVLRASPTGDIKLLATNAEIYGETLKFERAQRNLGYWGSEDDVAAWSIEVPADGKYAVVLEYACDDHNAGNNYVISVGAQNVSGTVDASGGWETFKTADAGAVTLSAGANRLAIRAAGKPKEFLFDLRSVTLKPVN